MWSVMINQRCIMHLHQIIPSTEVIQLTLTLKMTTAQVVETSVTVNNNSPIQDYVHPDDQTQPTFEMTPGFKPFTVLQIQSGRILDILWAFLNSTYFYQKLSISIVHLQRSWVQCDLVFKYLVVFSSI